MSDHAKKSPSAAYRWLNCPGSIRKCEGLKSTTTTHSMAGSIVHDLNRICLIRNNNATDYLGYWGWYNSNHATGVQQAEPSDFNMLHIMRITEKEVESSQLYLDVIRETRADHPHGIAQVEEKLDISWCVPDMFGTGDHVLKEFCGLLIVDDYKNGFGLVEIEHNPQFMSYALGALGPENEYMCDEVLMRVIQPNGMHHKGPVREWRVPVAYLYNWAKDVLIPGAARTEDLNAPLIPGSWCGFCEAGRQFKCEKQTALSVDTMFGRRTDITADILPEPPKPETLNRVQMDKILKVAGIMENWIASVQAEAYRRLETGDPDAPVNFKLVAGKMSDRQWAYNAEAVKVFGEDAFQPSKVRSPAQLEKVLALSGISPKERDEKIKPLLAERKPGKPVMVPIGDGRPALPKTIDKMFG